jgi:hypothetical protein
MYIFVDDAYSYVLIKHPGTKNNMKYLNLVHSAVHYLLHTKPRNWAFNCNLVIRNSKEFNYCYV